MSALFSGTPGGWLFCPHIEGDGCGCRMPQPGLVVEAAAALGVSPERRVVIGDIAAAAQPVQAAGVAAVVIPSVKAGARDQEILLAQEGMDPVVPMCLGSTLA